MRILFISRAFPPVIGGIERNNFEIAQQLGKLADVSVIANKRGKNYLPVFLPYATLKAVFLMRKYDAVILGDGVLASAGYLIKLFYGRKKKVIAIIHGLDITYSFWLYQRLWVGIFLRSLDKLVAVGNETIKKGVSKGISEDKFIFIPNGVNPDDHIGNYSRADLEKIVGKDLTGKKIILTSGRLAKRKGVAWFIENVMPRLNENVLYAVLGKGADGENIEKAIERKNLEQRVYLLGSLSNRERDILFNTTDIFVQPNIRVKNDMEGFGISVIEATTCKMPVVVANLEGLKDAVKDGENGFLVESGNAQAFVTKINELLENDDLRKIIGEKARKYAVENYSWDKIAIRYIEVVNDIIKGSDS
jgi:glycosyltransferase involved in cell wall biosynthesis